MENTAPPPIATPPPIPSEIPTNKPTRYKLWLFTTTVIIAAIASVLYFYILKFSISQPIAHAPTPTPTPVEKTNYTQSQNIDTSQWKTFKSKYGYLFKYPSFFTLTPNDSSSCDTDTGGCLEANLSYSPKQRPPGNYGLSRLEEGIYIYLYSPGYNKQSLTAADLIKKFKAYDDEDGNPNHLETREIVVGGAPAVKTQHVADATWHVEIPYKSKIYVISTLIICGAEKKQLECNTVFDQILSTFKFSDQQIPSPSKSINQNRFYSDAFFSVEVPTLLYATPQIDTKINGGYEIVTFRENLPYFSVQVTPDTPSMHNTSPSDKQIEFGGLQAVLTPVIAGAGADIYQPTIIFFTQGRAYVLTVGMKDSVQNREKANQLIQELNKTFKVL